MQRSRLLLSSLLLFLLISLPSLARAAFPEPFYFQNVSSTGALTTCTISSNTNLNSYYPYKIYTASPDPTVQWWLNQTYKNSITQLQGTLGGAGVANLSYVPPANQLPSLFINTIANTMSTNNQAANYEYGFQITPTSSGNVISVGINIQATGSANMEMAIYSDSGGNPNVLLGNSISKSLTTGWNDFPIVSNSVIFNAGTYYWLMFNPSNSNVYFYTNTTASSTLAITAETFGSWLSTFPGGSTSGRTWVANMRATYSKNYLYQIKEQQGASTQIYNLTVGTTMASINGQFTFNALCTPSVQYYQNCVIFPYASNVFTSKPTSWGVASDNQFNYYNLTGSNYNLANFSNANQSFTPRFNLIYNQFTPSVIFTANIINNPMANVIQQPLNMLLSNTIILGNRNFANFSVFSQETFNGLSGANLTLLFSGVLNGYTINKVISNTTSNATGLYFLSIPKSNYQNPTIVYDLNASLTKSYYYAQTDTYCPTTVPYGNSTFYPMGLVDTNGSKYTFYVYTSGGGSAAGYLMQILEQKGVGSKQVQSYLLPATLPFSLPLESTGQQYAYDVLSSNCKTFYFKGSYSTPTNPIYLTLSSTSTAYIYNTTQAFGICMLKNQTGGVDHINCYGGDSAQRVYQYDLNVYNSTSVVGTTALVYARNFSGTSFTQSFTLPKNNSDSYTLYAYVYRNNDPIILLNGGWLSIKPITLAAPLFGFIAFLMFITMILGGATTGKAIILLAFANIGMFLIALLTPIQVPLPVMVIFIILSVMAVWWDRPHK